MTKIINEKDKTWDMLAQKVADSNENTIKLIHKLLSNYDDSEKLRILNQLYEVSAN